MSARRKPPSRRRSRLAHWVAMLALLALVIPVGTPLIAYAFSQSDTQGHESVAHEDGSQCPDPCDDGHDCGADCSCTCCHARLMAIEGGAGALMLFASANLVRAPPVPSDPAAMGVRLRIFQPPRS